MSADGKWCREIGYTYLDKWALRQQEDQAFTEQSGLLRTGVLPVTPHIEPPSSFSVTGYLDPLVPMDDVITYCVQRSGTWKAHKSSKKRRIKWMRATASAGTPLPPETKSPSPAGTPKK